MTQPLAIPFGPTFVPGRAVGGLLFFDDFLHSSQSTAAGAAPWHDDSVNGVISIAAIDGGVLSVICNTAAGGDDAVAQAIGEPWNFEVGRNLYFETRVRLANTAEGAFFIGLSDRDADFTLGVPTAPGIGFVTNTNLPDIKAYTGNSSAQTIIDTSYDSTDPSGTFTWVILAFAWNAQENKIRYYVDGRLVVTMNIGDHNFADFGSVWTIIFSVERAAGSGVASLDVDYVLCSGERERTGAWDGSP